jgi:hypothetical protein
MGPLPAPTDRATATPLDYIVSPDTGLATSASGGNLKGLGPNGGTGGGQQWLLSAVYDGERILLTTAVAKAVKFRAVPPAAGTEALYEYRLETNTGEVRYQARFRPPAVLRGENAPATEARGDQVMGKQAPLSLKVPYYEDAPRVTFWRIGEDGTATAAGEAWLPEFSGEGGRHRDDVSSESKENE